MISIPQVARSGRNVDQPDDILVNPIMGHQAEWRAGSGEIGRAVTQHNGVQVDSILIDQSKFGEAVRQLRARHSDLPVALRHQLAKICGRVDEMKSAWMGVMDSYKLVIEVPSALVERAREVGLELDGQEAMMVAWLETLIRKREAVKRLDVITAKMQAVSPDLKPTPDEIAAEIRAVRGEAADEARDAV
jgi:hypothetical protein